MRRFFNKLLRDFKTTGTARGGRGTPRRAALQVEGLEDRMVLSTAKLNPLTGLLSVVASPGTFSLSRPGGPIVAHIRQITFEADKTLAGKLDVLDNGTLLGRFPIASVKAVTTQVAGLDAVNVDDSNGLPFATNVNMTLFGEGALNSLNVTGSRPFSPGADEGYTAGNGAADGELDTLNGNAFRFSNAIESVSDSIASDGILTDAFGSKVTLTGANGTQTLRGMSVGGAGDTFSFSHKKFVGLGDNSANATATLNTTAAATGEQNFAVAMRGNFTTVDIKATPSTVETDVLAGGVSLSNNSRVNLEANSGFVKISGGSATTVVLGENTPNGSVLTGIKANVSVFGVLVLSMDDRGNRTTQENVTVTESTVSATGLFGNSAVTVKYSNTASVGFLTGQLAETYTVRASKPGALFSSRIFITDGFPTGSLTVNVIVDPGSGLNLQLFHLRNLSGNAPTSLTFVALGATFSEPSPPTGAPFFDGTVDANFAGGRTSEIQYLGIEDVTLINSIANRLAAGA
jgi:hypothetical protein